MGSKEMEYRFCIGVVLNYIQQHSGPSAIDWGWRLVELKELQSIQISNYLAFSFNCNITKKLAALVKSAGKKDIETLL